MIHPNLQRDNCQWPVRGHRWWPGEVPAPGSVISTFSPWFLLVSGLSHAVGLAVGDNGVAVVQESVEQADGGGVFAEESSPGFKGQWEPMPRLRRS
jgi:hypothetical protein